ncbi:MAG: PHP domain-containing protein, partial [Bacteroidota bacterium]
MGFFHYFPSMILAKSYYSLRYGVISVENLVKRAASCRMDHLCLTDINNTSGVIELTKYCHEYGLRPIAGIEFRNRDTWLYTGIAKSQEGVYHLNNFLSHYRLRKKSLPARPPVLEEVMFVFPYGTVEASELKDNQFLGIRLQEINKIVGKEYPARARKLMAIHPVTFLSKEDLEVHRHLRAIDHNTLLAQLNDNWLAADREFFYPPQELKAKYQHFPVLTENARIIENLSGLHFGRDIKNKKTFTGSGEKDRELLETLAHEGMKERYGIDDPVARERVDRELEVINRLGFGAYFLITHDIIRYSMQRGFHHVGRGSGANSVVAYCLHITDVDPIELNLYFERFINPKRTSPPDFDIDFSWKERDEVLDYIFQTYPEEHTALLGTISTFRGRSIIRELGKVYGLPKGEIDSIVEQPGRHINQDATVNKIFQLAERLTDFPNLRSIHAGGVLISEKPVTCYTALDLPPKGYPTTQWDMYSAEDLGFEKLDIL